MRNLLQPLFIISAFSYLFLKICQKLGYHFPFFHDYLADFLCMPVVLSLALAFMRIVKQSPNYQLNIVQIIFATIFYSLLFEVIFPHFSPNMTSDWLDILAYFLGAFIFWRWMNFK